MYNRINLEILIQIIAEVFISLLLIVNLLSGRINLFIHPKFNVILWITAVILIIISIFSVFQLFKPKHMNSISKYFVIFIPILVTMYISSDSFSYMSKSSVGNQNFVSSDVFEKQAVEERTKYEKSFGKDYIDITDEMYLKWYYDSTLNWSSYKGEKFKMLCTVFKDDTQKEQFVVLGRIGMICCAADMQPCGFIFNEDGYKNLKNGQWYWVKGEIRENNKYIYNYEKLPMIYNVTLEEAREPIDKLVYIQ